MSTGKLRKVRPTSGADNSSGSSLKDTAETIDNRHNFAPLLSRRQRKVRFADRPLRGICSRTWLAKPLERDSAV
jgi:hypothetical protein